jgi:uncharacterized protein
VSRIVIPTVESARLSKRAQAADGRIVEAGHWFFCRIEGRRRIGKTTLLGHLARSSDHLSSQLIYMQTPDSDERDVEATLRRSLSEADREDVRALADTVIDFPSIAAAIGELCRAGMVVVLDEFQYFTRAALSPFNSFLQAEGDKLRSAGLNRGGLFVLGSLHSEMSALLEHKAAPLYGRITAQLKLDHWDFQDLMSVFRSQFLYMDQFSRLAWRAGSSRRAAARPNHRSRRGPHAARYRDSR